MVANSVFPNGGTLVNFHFSNSKPDQKLFSTETVIEKYKNPREALLPFPLPTTIPAALPRVKAGVGMVTGTIVNIPALP